MLYVAVNQYYKLNEYFSKLFSCSKNNNYLCTYYVISLTVEVKIMKQEKTINRLKVVLAEKNKTNRWLAEAIDKNEATISRWCNNKAQPSADMFVVIANALDVDVRDLFNSTKE